MYHPVVPLLSFSPAFHCLVLNSVLLSLNLSCCPSFYHLYTHLIMSYHSIFLCLIISCVPHSILYLKLCSYQLMIFYEISWRIKADNATVHHRSVFSFCFEWKRIFISLKRILFPHYEKVEMTNTNWAVLYIIRLCNLICHFQRRKIIQSLLILLPWHPLSPQGNLRLTSLQKLGKKILRPTLCCSLIM